eukprot:921196-Alexandrium_andersonii.AAC.1
MKPRRAARRLLCRARVSPPGVHGSSTRPALQQFQWAAGCRSCRCLATAIRAPGIPVRGERRRRPSAPALPRAGGRAVVHACKAS